MKPVVVSFLVIFLCACAAQYIPSADVDTARMAEIESTCLVSTPRADQTEKTYAVSPEMTSLVAQRLKYHGIQVRIFQPVDGIILDLSDCETITTYSIISAWDIVSYVAGGSIAITDRTGEVISSVDYKESEVSFTKLGGNEAKMDALVDAVLGL